MDRRSMAARAAGRGMVTVELALASVLLAAVLAGCVLAAGAMFRLAQCQLTANEVARQQARGDAAGVARAREDAPAGARIELRREAGVVVVTVELEARIGPAEVPLTATARVIEERS